MQPCTRNDHEGARVMWASPALRERWTRRIGAVSSAWLDAEIASVTRGVRSAALVFMNPARLAAVQRRVAEDGCVTAVVDERSPFGARVLVCQPAYARDGLAAWESGDTRRIGTLLGFPACCVEWFADLWAQGVRDPTLHMATCDGPREANILLRWIGVRLVPHLPCSGECAETARLGQRFRPLLPADVGAWVDEILDWPVRWTAHNGILEIETPVCKVQGTTDHTERRVVDRPGAVFPRDAPRGIRFPFGGAVRALPVGSGDEDEAAWRLNGFSSRDAMEAAHAALVRYVDAQPGDIICDLGAGTGRLLCLMGGRERLGVEWNEACMNRAADGVSLSVGDLHEWQVPESVTVALVAPVRLQAERAAALLTQLRRVPRVVVHAYRDAPEPLEALCRAAGMRGSLQGLVEGPEVAVAEWIWNPAEVAEPLAGEAAAT